MSINTILKAPKAIGSIPAAVKHYNDALSLSSDNPYIQNYINCCVKEIKQYYIDNYSYSFLNAIR